MERSARHTEQMESSEGKKKRYSALTLARACVNREQGGAVVHQGWWQGTHFRAPRVAERTQPTLPGEAKQAPPCCHLKTLLPHISHFRKQRGIT